MLNYLRTWYIGCRYVAVESRNAGAMQDGKCLKVLVVRSEKAAKNCNQIACWCWKLLHRGKKTLGAHTAAMASGVTAAGRKKKKEGSGLGTAGWEEGNVSRVVMVAVNSAR